MKNRGFFLIETLIVTTVVALAMVALYSQVTTVLESYDKRSKYNNANNMYAMIELNDYIIRDNRYTTFTTSANITVNAFNAITCSMFSNTGFCGNLYTDLRINKLIITTYNTTQIKTRAATEVTFSDGLKEFISNIKKVTTAPANKYRIIAEFQDGSFGTMALDSGIDTIAPTITYKPGYAAALSYITGEAFDPREGLIATDNLYGDITDNIVCTGSASPYSCSVRDSSNNLSNVIPRTLTAVGPIWNYAYTGGSQTFTAPVPGHYQVELWGAQGGTRYATYQIGGLGAYAKAVIYLTRGQLVYIYVGNQGSSVAGASATAGGYNGGGNGGAGSSGGGGSGGGATDIRIGGTAVSNRRLVAGGGGGAAGFATTGHFAHGGFGGGAASAGNGTYTTTTWNGTGASYTAVGLRCTINTNGSPADGLTTGVGGLGGSNVTYGGGGGGGGYRGGGGGCYQYGGGGGGSSYFDIATTTEVSLIAGNAVMPNPSGGTMTGRTGTGYARITFLSR